jgi:hypothetical protein
MAEPDLTRSLRFVLAALRALAFDQLLVVGESGPLR